MITEYDFELAYDANSWKRVGDTHPIDLYFGKDDKGRCAIEYTGEFKINKKICSSSVIEINHYKTNSGKKSIIFESRVKSPSSIAKPAAVETMLFVTEKSVWGISFE